MLILSPEWVPQVSTDHDSQPARHPCRLGHCRKVLVAHAKEHPEVPPLLETAQEITTWGLGFRV